MLIIGTGGMAREAAGSLEKDSPQLELYFYNNIDKSIDKLWNRYTVYHTEEEVLQHFKLIGNQFICCVSNPLIRKRLIAKFQELGGELINSLSDRADISNFTNFSAGVVVQPGCVVGSDVTLKEGVFLNAGAIVGHDSVIGEYVSLGPGCRILGGVEIGDYSYIGCNAVILPGVKIGSKVRVGIGKIVDRDLPDNTKF